MTAKGRNNFHVQLKRMIENDGLFQQFGILPLEGKFTEVRLPINDKELDRNGKRGQKNLPLADAGGKISEDALVFVEFDSGGQISHTLLKFLYYLENPKKTPEKLFLFHIYGKEFNKENDPEGNNYLFHKRLVKYLCDRIRERCKGTEFIYVPSRADTYGFESADRAHEWLEEKFEKVFTRQVQGNV